MPRVLRTTRDGGDMVVVDRDRRHVPIALPHDFANGRVRTDRQGGGG